MTLSVSDCTISGNFGSGLLSSIAANSATLTNCTISGNSTAYNGAGLFNVGSMTLTNCTVSGNSAAGDGGGLENLSQTGGLWLIDCTISGNDAAGSGGGLYDSDNGTVTLTDTIIAGNTTAAGDPSDIVTNGSGTITGSFNLIGPGGAAGLSDGVDGNIVLTSLADLGLAPLADNGGSTRTMALLPGSPALGAGTAVAGVTTDQRGEQRPASLPDIGAFQTAVLSLVVESTSGSLDTDTATLTLAGAVSLANQSPESEITFDPAVFGTPQTITLATGELELSSITTISGPTAGLTISGGGASRVFQIDSARRSRSRA